MSDNEKRAHDLTMPSKKMTCSALAKHAISMPIYLLTHVLLYSYRN